jgi:uncharacterized BrkB/YihY/UPF0761 family membrane protein
MKYRGVTLALIIGTVLVTLLRRGFPQADSTFLSLIDQNLFAICAALFVFFAYCYYLLMRHQKSSSNRRRHEES